MSRWRPGRFRRVPARSASTPARRRRCSSRCASASFRSIIGAAMSQAACPHGDAHIAQRVCLHLFKGEAESYSHRFTGQGIAYDLLCPVCAEASALADDETTEPPAELLAATCAACFEAVAARSTWATGERAVLSAPALAERATRLSFQHEMLRVPTGFGAPLRDLV